MNSLGAWFTALVNGLRQVLTWLGLLEPNQPPAPRGVLPRNRWQAVLLWLGLVDGPEQPVLPPPTPQRTPDRRR